MALIFLYTQKKKLLKLSVANSEMIISSNAI